MPAAIVTLLHALIFAGLICALPAAAAYDETGDHIISREVFRDTTGTRSLDEVIGVIFSPVQSVYAGGYTPDTIWMRLIVRPAADGDPLILHILPAYLNEITLFEPSLDSPDGWRTQITGNKTPWRERPNATVALGFSITPVAETTYYLRLKTLSNSMLGVEALPTKATSQIELSATLWQGLYMAIILWVVLWALQDYWLSRDRIILLFAGVYIVYLFYVLAILGYLSVLLPEATQIAKITSWAVIMAVLASLTFHRRLLMLYEVSRTARWALNTLFVASLATVCLMLLDETASSLKLSSLIALIAAPALFLIAMTARGDAMPGLRHIKIGYGLLCLSLLSYVPAILGLSSAYNWTLYGALIHGLISAIIFGSLLHWRSQKLVDNEARAQLKLRLSEQHLAMEKEQLIEQNRFTAMLTHELKNPLAAIRLSLDALPPDEDIQIQKRHQRINRALVDIDALVERCILSDHIKQRRQEIRPTPINIVHLVEECLGQLQNTERIRIEADAELYPITSDEQLLSVTISNLLDNALKYSPADSPVEVHLRVDTEGGNHSGIRVVVINLPGPAGFPDSRQAFDKYFRGEKTTQHSGTGLGLFLAKGIAERLGGRIDYLPQSDQIIFSLWLPQTLL